MIILKGVLFAKPEWSHRNAGTIEEFGIGFQSVKGTFIIVLIIIKGSSWIIAILTF